MSADVKQEIRRLHPEYTPEEVTACAGQFQQTCDWIDPPSLAHLDNETHNRMVLARLGVVLAVAAALKKDNT